MTKGKNKRKRERAKQRAEKKKEQVLILDSKMDSSQKKASSKTTDTEGYSEKEDFVRLSERTKRYGITDWLIAAFTFVLAGVGIYQYFAMDKQLCAMKDSNKINREALEAV